MFDDNHKSELSSLSKGDRVTVQGECAGKTLTTILLRDSSLNR
jgi:hypothetical protein